jgi:hypothetical protein
LVRKHHFGGGFAVRGRQRFGVVVDQRPDGRGRRHEPGHVGALTRGGEFDELVPHLGQADPVRPKEFRQRCALERTGPAGSGRLRQVRRFRALQGAHDEVEVDLDRLLEFGQRDELGVTVDRHLLEDLRNGVLDHLRHAGLDLDGERRDPGIQLCEMH